MIHSRNGISKKFLYLIIPLSLQQLLLAAVSAGDSLMLGFVNGDAMAAVSLAANIEFVENLFFSALVGGATVLSAQYWGKGDRNTIERLFGLILRYAVPISVLFMAFSLAMPERLMGLFTDETTLIPLGAEYIRMAAGSYLLTGVSQCYLCIMKTTGQTKQSVLISSSALCLDTALNVLFIFGFHMDAAGAALTTSITRFVEFVIVLIYAKNKMTVKPKLFSNVSPALHKDFLHCSIPHLINSMLWGLGTTVYASIIGHLGTAITTAYSAAAIVRNLSTSLCRGLAQGVEILLADLLGAGKMQEAKAFGGKMRRFSLLCGVVCGILAILFGTILSHFMHLSADAKLDLNWMILISAFYVFTQCISIIVVCGIFVAGGDTAFDAYSVAVVMWLIIIPMALGAAFWWKLPPLAVYAILSLDEVIKIPWIYAHYQKYKWLKNITREGTIMTMKERIRQGKLFTDMCEEMPKERATAKRLQKKFNDLDSDDIIGRMAVMEQIFGKSTFAWIEPPFYFCYGTHIHLGNGTYINVNCNFIDDGEITIGEKVMFGPAVTIATVGHPIKPDMRKYMYADPVVIGDNCWIGANVTICPGVTIGENSVIGAGSVVTRDIPANVVAVGNPCRVLRKIDQRDDVYYYKDKKFSDSGIEED